MARYVLTGTRRNWDGIANPQGLTMWGQTYYISRNGCVGYTAERAAVYRTLKDAQDEREYWNATGAPNYSWTIEQLPRGPVFTAVLRAKPVEV